MILDLSSDSYMKDNENIKIFWPNPPTQGYLSSFDGPRVLTKDESELVRLDQLK
jgi:hypothetical protein